MDEEFCQWLQRCNRKERNRVNRNENQDTQLCPLQYFNKISFRGLLKMRDLPVVLAPTFRKQPAPSFRYRGSWANGMPFRFDRKGTKRSTKRA